ncbi:MAG: flagellar biosynthesis protein FliQ [Bdellovibrionota bacterium]
MDDLWVMDLGRNALQTMLMIGGPLLLVALVVGLLVSVFQALTQINEATLTFIPKILAIGGTLLIMGPWMIRIMTSFTTGLYENINLHVR